MKAILIGHRTGKVIDVHYQSCSDALDKLLEWSAEQGRDYETLIVDDDGDIILDLSF